MGVDFFNCSNCGTVTNDCISYSCEGCSSWWCSSCEDDVEYFWYDDEIRCSMCFPPQTKTIPSEELLHYICKKYNTSLKEEEDAYRKEHAEEYAPVKDHVYTCTNYDQNKDEADEHRCGRAQCANVSRIVTMDSLKEYATANVRGVCCVLYYKDDSKEWCGACIKASNPKRRRKKH
jgi:hypothetical protein